MDAFINKEKKELLSEYENEKIIISDEDGKKYIGNDELRIKENVIEENSKWVQYVPRTISDADLDELLKVDTLKELKKMRKDIHSLKSMVVFFTVITIISIVLGFIGGVSWLDMVGIL